MMKPKLKYVLVVVALATAGALFVLAAERNDPAVATTGRFVLFQGVVEVLGKNGMVTQNVLFRLDTATGKTCQYVGDLRDGGLGQFWGEIRELEEAARLKKLKAEKEK